MRRPLARPSLTMPEAVVSSFAARWLKDANLTSPPYDPLHVAARGPPVNSPWAYCARNRI